MMNVCEVCGSVFEMNSHNHKYCSDLCRNKTIECIVCGRERSVPRSSKAQYCSVRCRNNSRRKPHVNFVKELLDKHDGLIVPLEHYTGSDHMLRTMCLSCNREMEREAHRYIGSMGYGCSYCGIESKGEATIRKWLEDNGFEYSQEYVFEDLVYRGNLRYDFAVFVGGSLEVLIEFDGLQHYEPREYFGGVDEYNEIVIRDRMKDEYADVNNYTLLRIRYDDEDNIDSILSDNLLEDD